MIEVRNRHTKQLIHETEDFKNPLDYAMKKNISLKDADFSHWDLHGAIASRGEFSGATFTHANLTNIIMRLADAKRADFSFACADSGDFSGSDLSGADLKGADFLHADLGNVNFKNADLRYSLLGHTRLKGANLDGARFEGADLRYTTFENAKFDRANFDGAILRADQVAMLERPSLGLAKLAKVEPLEMRERFRSAIRALSTIIKIPVVPNLDHQIYDLIVSGHGWIDMDSWHQCSTTHCRAGWAIHLAGKDGERLELRYGPQRAGGFIYLASTGRLPNFFDTNDDTLADIKHWASQPEEE